jgi:hypothetical protein
MEQFIDVGGTRDNAAQMRQMGLPVELELIK